MTGRFDAPPQVELGIDGLTIKLLRDLVFTDGEDLRWAVPKDAVVDGASIPKVFWSALGGPLDGQYRDASIIHDWFCDRKTRTWQATHRVFFEAMIVSGVKTNKAKLMYFAVWWGGPRWELRTSINTNLASDSRYNSSPDDFGLKIEVTTIRSPSENYTHEQQIAILKSVEKFIGTHDVSPGMLESVSDRNMK